MRATLLPHVSVPVCEATVTALPDTGSAPSAWLIIAGALALIVGIMLVLCAARRMASRRFPAALALGALLACGILLAPHTAVSAHAAPGQIDYSTGCVLIHVDQVTLPDQSARLLPGDTATVITAIVTNSYTAPIELTGTATIDSSAIPAGVIDASVTFDGATGPVDLQPGQSVAVAVAVSLPPAADNTAQHLAAPLRLGLTATAQ